MDQDEQSTKFSVYLIVFQLGFGPNGTRIKKEIRIKLDTFILITVFEQHSDHLNETINLICTTSYSSISSQI